MPSEETAPSKEERERMNETGEGPHIIPTYTMALSRAYVAQYDIKRQELLLIDPLGEGWGMKRETARALRWFLNQLPELDPESGDSNR